MAEGAIIARVLASPLEVDATAWNALLALQSHPTPFMRHEYLAALHESESAVPHTGWTPRFMTLWEGDLLVAACPLYLKSHSYGEYVFDWAWASAYEQHGVPYYPKAVVAVPFTPVPGTRLMARDAAARQGLVQALCQWCEDEGISSLHVLFASDDDVLTGAREGLMLRHTVQFHWKNVAPTLDTDVSSLPPEGALAALGRPGGSAGTAPTLGTDVSSLPPRGGSRRLGTARRRLGCGPHARHGRVFAAHRERPRSGRKPLRQRLGGSRNACLPRFRRFSGAPHAGKAQEIPPGTPARGRGRCHLSLGTGG